MILKEKLDFCASELEKYAEFEADAMEQIRLLKARVANFMLNRPSQNCTTHLEHDSPNLLPK